MTARPRPPRREFARAAGLLALVIALLYGRAVGFPFVYDDGALIESNRALADLSTLPEALTHDLFHFSSVRTSPYWRPAVTASYYVDHAVGGGAPWAFHLSNLRFLWEISALSFASREDVAVRCDHACDRGVPFPEQWRTGLRFVRIGGTIQKAVETAQENTRYDVQCVLCETSYPLPLTTPYSFAIWAQAP